MSKHVGGGGNGDSTKKAMDIVFLDCNTVAAKGKVLNSCVICFKELLGFMYERDGVENVTVVLTGTNPSLWDLLKTALKDLGLSDRHLENFECESVVPATWFDRKGINPSRSHWVSIACSADMMVASHPHVVTLPVAGSFSDATVGAAKEVLQRPIVANGHTPDTAHAQTAEKKTLPYNKTLRGVVKRYNPTRGFGFIASDGCDIFVHQSGIAMQGFRALNVGANVNFRVETAADGSGGTRLQAIDVIQETPYIPHGADRWVGNVASPYDTPPGTANGPHTTLGMIGRNGVAYYGGIPRSIVTDGVPPVPGAKKDGLGWRMPNGMVLYGPAVSNDTLPGGSADGKETTPDAPSN